jgi:hypothetical protein
MLGIISGGAQMLQVQMAMWIKPTKQCANKIAISYQNF